MDNCTNNSMALLNNHPCYDKEAHLKYARMHLPVAPKCNILCNYCKREYDCANESRPGVTSNLLSPEQASELVDTVLGKVENLAVVGIAGPGDPLANPEKTFATFRLIKHNHPELRLCFSTNGLALMDNINDIVDVGISHVTVTVNAVEIDIAKRIYDYVMLDSVSYFGEAGSCLLLKKQQDGILALKRSGILVKVNTLLIPGINDHHIIEISRAIKKMGVDLHNIIPLIPVKGTKFENIQPPSHQQRLEIQNICEPNLPQMRHCRQCRADAVGRLYEPGKIADFIPKNPVEEEKKKIRFAVASKTGVHVDAHFGHVKKFYIHESDGESSHFLEERDIQDQNCNGPAECDSVEDSMDNIAGKLADCSVVLCQRIGYYPTNFLKDKGFIVEECYGSITGETNRIAAKLTTNDNIGIHHAK